VKIKVHDLQQAMSRNRDAWTTFKIALNGLTELASSPSLSTPTQTFHGQKKGAFLAHLMEQDCLQGKR
jgi:hypothetical protein